MPLIPIPRTRSNGIYLPPKVIRLKGKNTVEEIGVVKKDMPGLKGPEVQALYARGKQWLGGGPAR